MIGWHYDVRLYTFNCTLYELKSQPYLFPKKEFPSHEQSPRTRREGSCAARLTEILAQLAERGVKQCDVAFELNVPTQYVSDLRHGRRTLSEPFARRIADAYRVSAAWLLHGEGPRELPDLAAASARRRACLLPVLSAPDQGDPRHSPHWDGGLLALSGAAAAAAELREPAIRAPHRGRYCLRRLEKERSDSLLPGAPFRRHDGHRVAKRARRCWRRAAGKGRYETLRRPAVRFRDAEPVGCCLGIVWSRCDRIEYCRGDRLP